MDGIVMRVYGIGPDDGEVEGEKCPDCESTNTEFILFEDEAHNTMIYRCNECAGTFNVDVDIPF